MPILNLRAPFLPSHSRKLLRRSAGPTALLWMALGLFLFLLSGPIFAQKVRLVVELEPPDFDNNVRMLDGGRFVYVGWKPVPDGSRVPPREFHVLDLTTRQVSSFTVPLGQYVAADPARFPVDARPSFSLVSYDGRVAGLLVDEYRTLPAADCIYQRREKRLTYMTYDTQAAAFAEPVELYRGAGAGNFAEAGTDGRYFYYAAFSNDLACGKFRDVSIRRVGLDGELDDWRFDLQTQGGGGRLRLSPDQRAVALLEYSEAGDNKKTTEGFLVDIAGKVVHRIQPPPTPYGLACDFPTMCVVAANQTGRLHRYDLQKGTSAVLPGTKLMHLVAFTPNRQRVLIFWNSILGPKHVEVREWPSLKIKKKIPTAEFYKKSKGFHPEDVLVTPDGRYVILPRPAASGFPDDRGVLIFDVTDE